MHFITRHSGILKVVERLPSSANGNPRYRCTIDGESFVTAVDSSHGYAITNHDGKKIEVTLGTHYNRRTLNTIERTDFK